MCLTTVLLLGLAILACAAVRAPDRSPPRWARHFQSWHKVFGVVALLLALVIMLNPELLALGLVGDASFFDVLVLLLGLQLQTLAARAWHSLRAVATQANWLVRFRLARSCSLVLLTLAPLVTAIHKALQRLSS